MRKSSVPVDVSQEDQGQHEEVIFMSPKKVTIIDLTVTSASNPMSVDNTDDELVVTRATIETSKP